jgi:LysR family nitrogen assimilation transcriptional regulator
LQPAIALEVDGVRAILDLVAGGHGHAVLARNALADAGDAARLVALPITPALRSTLAIATSAGRPLTRLAAETAKLITEIGPALLKS